jgi:exosortase A-associated hydrolase 1
MIFTETPLVFDCERESLVGILTEPSQGAGDAGVIVVVGGPQYRAGSHRHFVLLSRDLAAAGIPCLRFDYRGMGDSEGETRNFSALNSDIRAAVDTLLARSAGIKHIVLWGLCDGATAAAFYAAEDTRISGLVLLNPWVHTEQAEAKVYLKRYYLQRLASASFWRKVRHGEFNIVQGLAGLGQMLRKVLRRPDESASGSSESDLALPDRLYRSLNHRPVQALTILSGKDFVANEFEDLVQKEKKWQQLIKTVDVIKLPDADHTFSEPVFDDAIEQLKLPVAGGRPVEPFGVGPCRRAVSMIFEQGFDRGDQSSRCPVVH